MCLKSIKNKFTNKINVYIVKLLKIFGNYVIVKNVGIGISWALSSNWQYKSLFKNTHSNKYKNNLFFHDNITKVTQNKTTVGLSLKKIKTR